MSKHRPIVKGELKCNGSLYVYKDKREFGRDLAREIAFFRKHFPEMAKQMEAHWQNRNNA